MKLILKPNQGVFFTSDTHINHKNICRGVSDWAEKAETRDLRTRDFPSLEKMNDKIINNINSRVGEDDILFHLGDFSFGGHERIPEFRQRIVCKNIVLILGNHDEHIQKNTNNYRELFSSVHHYLEVSIRIHTHKLARHLDYNFVLCHFPIASWNNIRKNWIHLHGHIHSEKSRKIGPGKMLDVGVDGNDLIPYSLLEVLNLVKERPNKSMMTFDHHSD